jgi:aromatic ring-opening dioxygenase catalytic subunit (LigB family)
MLTSRALLLPSVPTMLIDEQRGDFTEMIEAVTAAGERLASEKPDALVALSARWLSAGPFHADDAREHRSVIDLPGFGVEPRYDCPGVPELARALVKDATSAGVRAACARRGIDTGLSVPLHFLVRGRRLPVVPVSLAVAPQAFHRAWGESIRHTLEKRPERLAFVVGGALAFNLHAFNLRRDVEEARELDERVLESLRLGAWSALAELEPPLLEKAQPEAELRHLEVLRGFLLGDVPGRVLEHETSPGLGTALVEFPLEPIATG